jgi:GcrA cell cycle regulator
MTWTEAQVRTLIRMWNTDSATKIGKELKITRNAVIGKAHRLGLAAKTTGPKEGVKQPGRRTNLINRSRIEDWRKAHKVVHLPDVLIPDAPIGKTFMELGLGDCRWPIGDLYCGAQTEKTYCLFHYRRSLRKSEDVQRSPTEGCSRSGEVRPYRGAATS